MADSESFSSVPIKDGVHAYSDAPDFEVTVITYAEYHGSNDIDVKTIDRTAGDSVDTFRDAVDRADKVVFHNSGFDRIVLAKSCGIVIPASKIHDTMIQALAHGLPGSLAKLGEIFGIPEDKAKDKEGHGDMLYFCKPLPKNSVLRRATRDTHPDRWERFLHYARRDIFAMLFLFVNMPRWNYPGNPQANRYRGEYDNWLLDQAINDRGIMVDQDLARAAIDAVNIAQKANDERTADMTDGDVDRTNQRDKLLQHLLGEYGVTLPDMQKSTLERRLNDPDLPDAVRELIALRLEGATTSNSKYNTLLKSVSADGRLRGTLQFCGAARTGRDAGRLFQPQNLPRPDMAASDIALGIDALKAGTAHLLFDSPIKLASNAIRGAIVAAPGKKLVQGDFAQIEARVLPWLAGETWKLDAFRAYDAGDGPDLYKVSAARVLGKDAGGITKPERQRYGKVPELACGYGGAKGAFKSMARLLGGDDISDAESQEIVNGWRKANVAIADWDDGLWAKLNRAAFDALRQPDQVFDVNGKVSFEKWRSWLRFTLPSGRALCYADPQIIEDPRMPGKMTLSYMGLNSYTRKWERLTTYGGKLSADGTQATARDILWHAAHNVEAAGFPIVSRVHDELITEPVDSANQSVDKMIAAMVIRPPWVDEQLPLAADGFEDYRYRKDG
jgi:DNA polymerase